MAFMDKTLTLLPTLDEEGRHRVIEDTLAAMHGQSNMRRYISPYELKGQPTEQHAEAQQSVALLKLGIEPLITSKQDPVIYASTWLQAAAQAAGSLQSGGNPVEVFRFLQVCGPAIAKQLARFENDPTRKQVYGGLLEQWKELAKVSDQLGQMIQKQQQQQQQEQARMQQAAMAQNGDLALKNRELQAKLAMSEAKTRSQLSQKQAKHDQSMRQNAAKTQQSLAIKDATTAVDITLQRQKAESSEE